MDRERFDALVRLFGANTSRRAILATLFGAGSLGEGIGATAKGGKGRKRKRRDKNDSGAAKKRQARVRAAAAPAKCFTGSPCNPGPGKNLGKCNFGGSTTLKNKTLKGANLGSANLARADASGANLEGANLDKACLVDARLIGAKINGSTNIATAILCRTTMPDGSINDSGCGKDSACCSTCGEVGQPCCAGGACDGALVCDPSDTCVVCGRLDAPCCPAGGGPDGGPGTCDGTLICDTDGICVPCGQEDAACCPDGSCANGDLACGIDQICVPCGVDVSPCCAGRVCEPGLGCFDEAQTGPNGYCFPCGGRNERCCGNTTCDEPDLFCVGGQCRPCDVCASGCQHTSVDAAIAAAAAGAQILICPGVYRTNSVVAQESLTLIGIGSGATLDGGDSGQVLANAPSSQSIQLRNLTIRNGRGELGGGLRFSRTRATLQDCRVTNNTATATGGGIYSFFTVTTLERTTVSGNEAPEGGGIFSHSSPLVLTDNSHVTDNDANPEPGSGGGVKVISLGTFTASGGSTVTGNRPDDCVGCS